VTFDAEDCGESMGEKSYTDLKTEVGQLKDVVGEQQSEIGAIFNAFSSFYYGGTQYCYTCALILLHCYMCPHTYQCYVSSYFYTDAMCVLILL
jgi:hypothetical protein